MVCSDGEWSAAFPECRLSRCQHPDPSLRHTRIEGLDLGERRNVTCANGFEAVEGAEVECSASGEWIVSRSEPCRPKTCKAELVEKQCRVQMQMRRSYKVHYVRSKA